MREAQMIAQRLEERNGEWVLVLEGPVLDDGIKTGESVEVEIPAKTAMN